MALNDVFMSTPGAMRYISSQGDSHSRSRDGRLLYDADLSYGPIRHELAPLGIHPPGDWANYSTLKVEVGHFSEWERERGSLDWKARVILSQFERVAYVLCVKVERDLASASYKLYTTSQTGELPPFIEVPIPIEPPTTTLDFDSVRLLGAQPSGFPGFIGLDLHAALPLDRRRLGYSRA